MQKKKTMNLPTSKKTTPSNLLHCRNNHHSLFLHRRHHHLFPLLLLLVMSSIQHVVVRHQQTNNSTIMSSSSSSSSLFVIISSTTCCGVKAYQYRPNSSNSNKNSSSNSSNRKNDANYQQQQGTNSNRFNTGRRTTGGSGWGRRPFGNIIPTTSTSTTTSSSSCSRNKESSYTSSSKNNSSSEEEDIIKHTTTRNNTMKKTRSKSKIALDIFQKKHNRWQWKKTKYQRQRHIQHNNNAIMKRRRQRGKVDDGIITPTTASASASASAARNDIDEEDHDENNWMDIIYNSTAGSISQRLGFEVDFDFYDSDSYIIQEVEEDDDDDDYDEGVKEDSIDIFQHDYNNNQSGSENERIGNRVSTLLSDIKDKLNTDDVSEKESIQVESWWTQDDKNNYSLGHGQTYEYEYRLVQIIRGGNMFMEDFMHRNGSNVHEHTILHCPEERMNLVSSSRVETSKEKKVDAHMLLFDIFGRNVALISAGIVLSQSIGSFLAHDDNAILDEFATKLFSKETAFAMKNIRKIIKNFPEHGVVDVFSEYPTKDVVMSVLALAKLQRAFYTVNTSSDVGRIIGARQVLGDENVDRKYNLLDKVFGKVAPVPIAADDYSMNDIDIQKEYKLLADLAHYSVFAHAAYGWKMGLLSGKIHMGDLETLLRKTGIEEHHVIDTNWKSKTHLPAYFIVRDVHKKSIVLCIRGTLSAKDVLTDLCCTAESFLSHEEAEEAKLKEGEEEDREGKKLQKSVQSMYNYRAHQGMVNGARGVSKMTYEMIRSELDKNPDYKLVLVGHSLGGGVAAVLGTLWRDTFPGLKVFAFGCPCVAPLDCYPTMNENIVSVVGEGDPFSCLSLGHLADTSSALSKLCENEGLRNEILNRTKMDIDDMVEEDVKWCIDTLESLSIQGSVDNSTEKFYPPGRVLHLQVKGGNFLRSNVNEVTLTEVKPQYAFRDLKLHPRMFDLSLHVPHRYEMLLSRIWSNLIKRI